MKKIRCPRCDNYILFDEAKYLNEQIIHLQCTACGRKYGIRIGKKTDDASADDTVANDGQTDCGLGEITVLENDYCYKQTFFLSSGENIVGRRSKGTETQIPIDSDDITLARNHCVIRVKKNKKGEPAYALRDFPSRYGTYLNGTALAKNEWAALSDNDTIVLGSTTLIIHLPDGEKE